MITVTKTYLPDKAVYDAYLERIWKKGWLTNNGQLFQELRGLLKQRFEVANLQLTTNGTLPIQMAIKAFDLTGEVITTPFSYIATSAAIVWENLKPVFVDIDAEYLTIDEQAIEQAIGPETSAILATHVFGNPCHVEALEQIANKHGLKVIYDAAHCFDVAYKGQSVFKYGDASTCSFHATKLFHTAEGGAVFTEDGALYERLSYLGNFGHRGNYDYQGLGINAKMSELQAAMGLSILPDMPKIKQGRKRAVDQYLKLLDFEPFRAMKLRGGTQWNYSYFPIIFDDESHLQACVTNLEAIGVFPRRYFYPSLNTIPYLKGGSMPVSEHIASRILCLPLYHDISEDEVSLICDVINKVLIQNV